MTTRAALPDLATIAEQAIARAEKAEADLRGYNEDWTALYQAIGLSRDETDANKIGDRIRELVKAEADLKMLRDDPVAVHLNILRGTLAKPDIRSLLHLHGQEALARWDNAEKAEADLAEARRMLKEAEHGRSDAEHDLVEGIRYIRQTSRYVNDDRDCRAAWSWADDLQQRHDARVNARHQAREGK